MLHSSHTLRSHAQAIWQSGVDAVNGERLVREQVRVTRNEIEFGPIHSIRLDAFDRITVIGGGKAAGGLAVGIESVLQSMNKPLAGWVNVPSDCILPTEAIHLHPARPPGVNEPTAEAAEGTARILRMASELGPRDLCIVLIAGGGSALLPAPVNGVSLEDKLNVTQLLSGAGADIHQLNTVRKQLSRIKGGGLAQACGAGQVVTLIVSDVLGDPLDVIASGPTVANPTTAADALTILESFAQGPGDVPESVWNFLHEKNGEGQSAQSTGAEFPNVTNLLLANNETAQFAAAITAAQLGYFTGQIPTNIRESTVDNVSRELLAEAARLADVYKNMDAICLFSGGEPVVQLAAKKVRGRGGRNQQLTLDLLQRLIATRDEPHMLPLKDRRITFLSGGTDGEDGPTDAAGAILWPDLIESVQATGLDIENYLRRNDAYSLLESLDALVKTGPTHTNVCDVRVLLLTRDHRKGSGSS